MSKREELLTKHGASRYTLVNKLTHATAEELKNITQWEEYKESLIATEKWEKYEKENLNKIEGLLDVTDGYYQRNGHQ